MTIICQNCHQEFEGNYCNHCGQTAETHKINFHFLWHDIQHGLLHVDKGILFTARELFTRPGNTIREFIQGERVKHFRPISLVLVLAGIYGFLYHYFHINILVNNINVTGTGEGTVKLKNAAEELTEWITQHFAIIALASLPLYALSTWLAFLKSGYNYIEHLVLNSFLTAQRLILRIVLFPVFYFANNTPALKGISRAIDIAGIILMIWTLIQFFNKQKRVKTFWQALLSLLIFYLVAIVLVVVAVKIAIAKIQ